MLTTFFSAIPLWVFPLLFGLIWLGLKATQERDSATVLIYAIPLLGLLSLNRALNLPQSDAALGALLIFAAIGAIWGHAIQAKWIREKTGRRIRLHGEWVTMISLLSIFAANFTAGMMLGMRPELGSTIAFAVAFGACAGVIWGLFLGRALRVARHPRGTAAQI